MLERREEGEEMEGVKRKWDGVEELGGGERGGERN